MNGSRYGGVDRVENKLLPSEVRGEEMPLASRFSVYQKKAEGDREREVFYSEPSNKERDRHQRCTAQAATQPTSGILHQDCSEAAYALIGQVRPNGGFDNSVNGSNCEVCNRAHGEGADSNADRLPMVLEHRCLTSDRDVSRLTKGRSLKELVRSAPDFVFADDLDTLVEGIKRLDRAINENKFRIGQALARIKTHGLWRQTNNFVSAGDYFEYLSRELGLKKSRLYELINLFRAIDEKPLYLYMFGEIDVIECLPGIQDFITGVRADIVAGPRLAELLREGKYAELKQETKRLCERRRIANVGTRRKPVRRRESVDEDSLNPMQRKLYNIIRSGLIPVVWGFHGQEQETYWSQRVDEERGNEFEFCKRNAVRNTHLTECNRELPDDLDGVVRLIIGELQALRRNLVRIALAMHTLWTVSVFKAEILARGFNSVEAFCVEAFPRITLSTCKAYNKIGEKLILYKNELDIAGFNDSSVAWNLTRLEAALNRYPHDTALVFKAASHLRYRDFQNLAKGAERVQPKDPKPTMYTASVVRKAKLYEAKADRIMARVEDDRRYPAIIGVYEEGERAMAEGLAALIAVAEDWRQ